MTRTLNMFGPRPRMKPRKLMYFIDVGACPSGDYNNVARFKCKRCDYQSPWIYELKTAQVKRGLPCPKCNGDEQ